MVQFEIVEYDHSYAAALADMWNKSGDSWGGYNVEFTAESVRQEQEGSTAEARYMAVVGEEVVGLITLLKWTQGEGALYVGVLTVRPDYHGRKIGKALLLKTIERTTELGWGRLDLHTWGGNTKAVPLYKRSGFFWEERDQEVYCVNFIPGILRNELVADFFATVDWYADSDRPIEIKPDGRKENEFTYFTYSWKKGDRYLRMEYARKGRGLAAIDRNELSVKARVEDLNLVFGRSYTVRYEIENRTDTPLEIRIQGRDDQNIRFDFSHDATVAKSHVVEAEFFVGEIDRPQSEWKTHPRVTAEITINGKSALFEVGVAPKFPAEVSLVADGGLRRPGRRARAFLDVESNLPEEATFSFALPDLDCCRFEEERVERRLKPREKASIEIGYLPVRSGVYAGRVAAEARPDSGGTIDFSAEVGLQLPFLSGIYHGEMPKGGRERRYIIGNGPFSLALAVERDSQRNLAFLSNEGAGRGGVVFFPPKLGKPYTEEIMERRPDDLTVTESDGAITLTASFESHDVAGVTLRMLHRLSAVGVVERWFEVENRSEEPMQRELSVMDTFRCEIDRIVLPYKDSIIESSSEEDADIWSWSSDHLTGNWLFSRRSTDTLGLMWDPDLRPVTQEWVFTIEHSLGALAPGETARTKSVSAFIDAFSTWQELRSYATEDPSPAPATTPSTALDVNGGNPFVDGAFEVALTEHKQRNLDGAVVLESRSNRFGPLRAEFDKEQKVRIAEFEVPAMEAPVDVVTARVEGRVVQNARSAACFGKSTQAVKTAEGTRDGFAVLSVESDAVTFRVAPEFAPGLLSCEHGGVEWLDTAFPERPPRDWWNPWFGGVVFFPSGAGEQALLKQRRSAGFVELPDAFGNSWTGICITTVFSDHETLEGLEYDAYYMTLPGAPIVLMQANLRQETGTYFARQKFLTGLFVGCEPATDTSFSFENAAGRRVSIVSGHEEKTSGVEGPIAVRRAGTKTRMTVFAGTASAWAITNKRTSLITISEPVTARSGESQWTAPKFLVFADFDLTGESLRDLQDVRLG